MHDINYIRNNREEFTKAMRLRGIDMTVDVVALDLKNRKLKSEIQTIQAERNANAKQIGEAKKAKQRISDGVYELISQGKERERVLLQEQQDADEQLRRALLVLPNILDSSVPVGTTEEQNVEIGRWSGRTSRVETPLPHYELTNVGLDFANGTKLAGSRFTAIRGLSAQLYRALGQYMLATLRAHGYEEVIPPLLVNDETMTGTGQLPKFEEDLFRTTDGRWLIPTAEVSLTNLVRDEIIGADLLPMRLSAQTPCFRKEAGSAGKDTRGLIRQHQFDKVEMVSITEPDQSAIELERMCGIVESILSGLGLGYRKMLLCSGDVGFSAAKTYDYEVWMAGTNQYREISSISNCRDFQARRMNTRYRSDQGIVPVHTLNGSALAIGRTLAAVLEAYQMPDGSIQIPEMLRKFV